MQKETTRYSLADKEVIYRLCFEFVEMNSELAAKLTKEEISTEEAARRSADLVQWMGWTLGGENPDFIAAPDWSGAPLGRHLRVHFAGELIGLSDEDRAKFEDDETIILFAMCQFMGEAQSLIETCRCADTKRTEKEARAYHDLCVKWTELFTNKSFVEIARV